MENYPWQRRVGLVEKRRWLICVPLAFAFILSYFHRFAMGVVADDLTRDFALTSAAQLGLLSSIYFYTYAVLQLPAGICADLWGPRRTIAAALALTAAGTFVFGWAPDLTWLYAGRLLVSAGVAFIYINIFKFFAAWYRSREFGTISGLSSLTGNLGFAFAAVPLAVMVESAGWRASFYIMAFFTLLVTVYAWIVVRDTPGGYGWPSIEEIEAAEGVAQAPEPVEKCDVRQSFRTVTTNWSTWPPFVTAAACYSVYATFAGIWGVPYLMQIYGFSRVEAAGYMMVISVGYMASAPAVGYLSDRLRSRRWPFFAAMSLLLVSWLALTIWNGGKPPVAALYPLCFAIGAGAAGIALCLPCAKEVSPPHMTGIAAGLANIGPFLGAALGQPLFGLVLDFKWQGVVEQGVKIYPLEAFQLAFWMCAGLLAVAVVAAFLIKETGCANVAHEIIGRRQRQH
jgi:sugar phosphate permease